MRVHITFSVSLLPSPLKPEKKLSVFFLGCHTWRTKRKNCPITFSANFIKRKVLWVLWLWMLDILEKNGFDFHWNVQVNWLKRWNMDRVSSKPLKWCCPLPPFFSYPSCISCYPHPALSVATSESNRNTAGKVSNRAAERLNCPEGIFTTVWVSLSKVLWPNWTLITLVHKVTHEFSWPMSSPSVLRSPLSSTWKLDL